MPTAVMPAVRPDWDVHTLLARLDAPPVVEGSGGRRRAPEPDEPNRLVLAARWLRNAVRGVIR